MADAGQCVHLLDGEVELLHQPHDVDHAEAADAVGDEVRRVLGVDDAFAQPHARRSAAMACNRRGVGLRRGNDLQQAHVARRVEEVRAEPVPAELSLKPSAMACHGQSAGVGGDDGARLAHGLHLAQQRALELQVLHHGLDDPVALGQQVEMVVEVAVVTRLG